MIKKPNILENSRGLHRTLSNIYDGAFRSSRLDVFNEKGVLKNVVKFTGKQLRQSLFNTYFYRTPQVAASELFYENS